MHRQAAATSLRPSGRCSAAAIVQPCTAAGTGHREGAQLATTLTQIRQTSTLPAWAIASTARRRGTPSAMSAAPPRARTATIVRVARSAPRTWSAYYVRRAGDLGQLLFTAYAPVTRLFWIGASRCRPDRRPRPARRLDPLAQRGAAGAPAGGGERPARRRRSRRHRHPAGPEGAPGARGVLQRHERQADQGAGDRAGVPPLGQPRAEDAAHLHPRLRRGHRRRDRQAGRGRRGDRRRVQPAGAAGRRPARVRADAQGALHGPPRAGRPGRRRRGRRAPLRSHGARRRPHAAAQHGGRRRRRSPTTTASSRWSPTWSRTPSAARRRRAR